MNENDVPLFFRYDPSKILDSQSPSLPASYTTILPTRGGKIEPVQYSDNTHLPDSNLVAANAEDWKRALANMNEGDDRHSFAAFFSALQKPLFKTTSTLLPLLEESINSPAMVRHCMNVVKGIVEHLNPQQMVMVTADQPVYALGKQVQWANAITYKNIFWLMGPLHVEMALLSTIGDWLEGSGWTEVLKRSNISTTGRIES